MSDFGVHDLLRFLDYVKPADVVPDAAIVFHTVGAVLFGEGAR